MGVKPYEEGSRASAGLAGVMITKPSSKLNLWNPSYIKGRTVIRPWGDVHTNDQGQITMEPYRDNNGNFGTSFFVQDVVAKGWGTDFKVSFLVPVEDEENWPMGSPADIFFQEVRQHADFKHLTERSGTGFPPISAPSAVGFLKGLLIENAGTDYRSQPIWGALVMLPTSAKDAFERLLDTENPEPDPAYNNPDDPMGWYNKYAVGDPIGFEHGKVFEFDKESKLAADNSSGVEVNLDGRGHTAAAAAKGGGFEKYGCRINPHTPILSLDTARSKVASYDEPFESAFRYMTGAEQLETCIIKAFGKANPEAIMYVFGDKGVLPKSFENQRVYSTPPATTPQQQAAPPVPPQQAPAAPAPQQQPAPPQQQPAAPAPQQNPVPPQQPTQPQSQELGINLDGENPVVEAPQTGYDQSTQNPEPTPTANNLQERLRQARG